jgi:uncharacterized protein YdbL (DUF1318 family)
MLDKRIGRSTVISIVVLAAACVTVNIYFPAAEVQKAANRIVDDVRPEAVPAPPSPETPTQSAPQSLLDTVTMRLAHLWLSYAEAAVDINVSTPAVRKLKASIRDRFSQLRPLYKKGIIGENNRGYLEIRDMGGLGMKEKAEAKRLVQAENNDRRALYEEIIRANNLDPKFLSKVEKLFANSWREKAAANGWWHQKDDGGWAK